LADASGQDKELEVAYTIIQAEESLPTRLQTSPSSLALVLPLCMPEWQQ